MYKIIVKKKKNNRVQYRCIDPVLLINVLFPRSRLDRTECRIEIKFIRIPFIDSIFISRIRTAIVARSLYSIGISGYEN